MKINKTLSMIGLAKRAGKVVSGEFSVDKVVKAGQAYLVIVAEDASANAKKHYTDMCTFHECAIMFASTKEELGHAIGCEFRASVAILDEGLAKSISNTQKVSE